MSRQINKKALKTANLFKGLPDLILRRILSEPNRSYVGYELADELKISKAWVNRVLQTLELEGFAKREGGRCYSKTKLTNIEGLMQRWKLSYNIDYNTHHLYHCTTKDPLKYLALTAKKEGFQYAITGHGAKAIIKNKPIKDTPHVYILPSETSAHEIHDLLTILEDKHNFLPVTKKENIIILEPYQKGNVLFGSYNVRGHRVVGELQVGLDS